MKRNLLIAALLSASMPLGALAQSTPATGSSDPNMSGSTQRMFIINSTSPGALTFSGSGTAQFNNSVGTANQFNVGSNTNIGVNASVSATREFEATSIGNLSLAGTSTIMQSQGTSSQAANQTAILTQASTAAREVANSSSYGTSWSSSWASHVDNGGGWDATNSRGTVKGVTYTSSGDWEAASRSAWKTGWESTYKTAFETTSSQAKTAAQTSDASGVISGSFVTRENSNSKLSQSSSVADVVAAATTYADSATSAEYGTSVANNSFRVSGTGDWQTSTPTWYTGSTVWESLSETDKSSAYTASRSTFREDAYSKGAQAAAASVASVSDSQVKVTGLGAIVTINASQDSKFLVDLDRNLNITQLDSTATANGSAAASVGTSSYATQNNQRTASAFMQAFAGAQGTTTVTGAKYIEAPDANSVDQIVVTTEQLTTTTSTKTFKEGSTADNFNVTVP